MDFEFSTEEEQLRESVRRFLAERAPMSYVRAMLDAPTGTTDEIWDGLAQLGVIGLLAPEEHGGAGMGMTAMGVVLEELGRAVHPGPFLASAVGAVSLVCELAPDDALLSGLADGSVVGTVALWDEGQRWQWRMPSTLAEGERLTGVKAFVPDAGAADAIVTTAGVDGGLGVFVVDARDDGMHVVEQPTPDRTRRFATVELRGARARLLAVGDDAVRAVSTTIDRLAIAYVTDGVGAAGRALELAVDYAKQRQQFGQPIGSFQAVQHLCAEMLQALELGRAGAYYGLWAADAADADELHRAATMAQAYASDAFSRLGADAIQVFGGIGYTWEHDAHLFYKRLLTLEHVLGGSSDHLEELARLVVG